MADTLIQLAGFILPIGIFYGATNARIKQLEKHIDTITDVTDRLARIEEKTDFLINFYKNK